MINYTRVQKISAKEGIPEEIIEKDYLIELILYYLSKDKYLKDNFVFRGGTSLKKMYFKDYRFSEDLDFLTQLNGNSNKLENKIKNLLIKINNEYPYQLSIRNNSIIEKDRCQFFIAYNIIDEIRTTKELKLDISIADNIPASMNKKIIFTYEEFQGELFIITYNLESVVSDKIGRVLDVINEVRDIYDLWYLLKLNINQRNIKREFKNKYGYDIIISNLLSKISSKEYEKTWNIRLKNQINNLPDYIIVSQELRNLINTKLKDS